MASELDLVLEQLNRRFDDMAAARIAMDEKIDRLQDEVATVITTLGNGKHGALQEIRKNTGEIHNLALGYNMLASNVAKIVETVGDPGQRMLTCPVQRAIEAGKTALKSHEDRERERRTRRGDQ